MAKVAEILSQVSLQDKNTLRVAAQARHYLMASCTRDVTAGLEWAGEHHQPVMVLGGGSNVVLGDDFSGLVIHIAIRGRRWEEVGAGEATLVLGAGENWHESVRYAVCSGYRGIENLALIPGTAGAAPVQNIGAYGVELGDTLVSVSAIDRSNLELIELSAAECDFGYRDSTFKRMPDRYVITEIRLRLSRNRPLTLGYRDLGEYFGGSRRDISAEDVAEAVMAIRRRKLPDPGHIPNAGSFFKNPVVSLGKWEDLKREFPDLVAYPDPCGMKLAAGWLIDQRGWRGYRNERVGVHREQALVLINHSGGNGQDILALARRIQEDIRSFYGVELEIEPRLPPESS